MAVLEVAQRLCLGEHAVPVERLSLPFVDPYNLSTITAEFIVVSLVSFKASGSKGWLEQGLQVPSRWWPRNHASLPILQEILELIRQQNPKTGQSCLPRSQKSLIALKVRDRILWFQNDSRCVILGVLDGDKGLADFRWFLEELSKGGKDAGGPAAAGDIVELAQAEPGDPDAGDDLGTFITGALETLQAHQGCLRATYLPSRLSIRVVRMEDKVVSEFRLKNLKRKRAESADHDSEEPVNRQFDMVVSEAIKFLDSYERADTAGAEAPEAPGAAEVPVAGGPGDPAACSTLVRHWAEC